MTRVIVLIALGVALLGCPLEPSPLMVAQARNDGAGGLAIEVGDLWCEYPYDYPEGGLCRVAWSKSAELLVYEK